MPASRRSGLVLPALAVCLIAAVVVDVTLRAVRQRPAEATVAAATPGPAAPTAPAPTRAPVVHDEITGRSTGAVSPAPGGPAAAAARAAARRRIQLEGSGTYLPDMLWSADSTLHRWPVAGSGRVLRVAVVRSGVPGFREMFASNVAWAVSRWNGVGLPVQLETASDSAGADIVVVWERRLAGDRTGRADVTWTGDGAIVRVRVVLATHLTDGQPLVPNQMIALALHEFGHALGLGHSPVRRDAMHPETAAVELTARDRRTAALLYRLPPGSLR